MLNKNIQHYCMLAVFLTGVLFYSTPCLALDTDAYQVDVKQNAYIMLDNSGSMSFGVYENNVDYGAMYDYLFLKDGIGDTVASGNWYKNHNEKTKIFLVKGDISAEIINIDGSDNVFTGDAADPEYLWYSNDMVDTHTYIDSQGNLSGESGETQRITIDNNGYILLDGVHLPLGQNVLLKDFKTLYDGSMINEGFGGMVNAPGYYFSGLEGVTAGAHNQVEDGDSDIYFFITGNWMNMQQVYNLHYTSNPGSYAAVGDAAWKYEEFPLEVAEWSTADYILDYPTGSGDYTNNLTETATEKRITRLGAEKIQIHFSMFDVESDNKSDLFRYDYVALYDSTRTLVAKYDNDNSPQGDWSPIITGDTVYIRLKTDRNTTEKGYTIDQYRTVESSTDDTGSYLMQNRLDVAKDSLLYVIDEFRGKINWGFATFNYQGTSGNGATIQSALNPTENDDANRAAIAVHVENAEPKYGTPLGEALQDIFDNGYYGHRNSLDNLLCRKNFAIVVSDGYPSDDEDWSRISGVTFSDFDGDDFTADPYQYDNPPNNYYDDVAHWIYTHSWLDKSEITDPENSYENIIPHQIAFGAKHPLMRNAAAESGAEYITAYNKTQLVNAFHSLGMMISEAISFTAPAVSVDAENKIQNGNELYMGLFLPRDAQPWVGNLKKFSFGDGSTDRPYFWGIYDASDSLATDDDGAYYDNTDGFWGDENDTNDTDNNDGADIQEDGVGEILTERVQSNLNGLSQYGRVIKVWQDNALTDFTQANISPATLGLDDTDTETRNKIVNWAYGYSFDATETGAAIAARDWALGPIVHSRPTIIDYYDDSDSTIINNRYIAIGAGDGMLHIFDEATGEELLAFIPSDVLPKLKEFESLLVQPLVDGDISIIRKKPTTGGGISQPKYLIFTQRRGGNSIIALDIENSDPNQWTQAWQFSDGEMSQSWSAVEAARIQTGANEYTSVGIFTGGYDPLEDNFPEPFDDTDNDGVMDNNEWSQSNDDQDINNNNTYDTHNTAGDTTGRSFYVINLATGALMYSMKHCPADGTEVTTGTAQTSKLFKYCFPSSPAVIVGEQNGYSSVLRTAYAVDIYGNIFRFNYNYSESTSTGSWSMQHIFSANPTSLSESGEMGGGINEDEAWQKVFYSPAVSWRGSGFLFDQTNYRYNGVTFSGTSKIATLFFGTGDREHPLYNVTHDRIYAVYDDSTLTAKDSVDSAVPVSSVPYTENNLLNLTCDELGTDTTQSALSPSATLAYKTALSTLLADDVVNQTTLAMPMELDDGGNGENDAKGWYIILDQQTTGSYCDHCTYEATIQNTDTSDRDNHFGEKIISRLTLYDGVLYFSSYQRSFDDPCAPNGNALNYALDYLNASAALNLNINNDTVEDDGTVVEQRDITDRYQKKTGITALPSALSPVTRKGETYIPGFDKLDAEDLNIYYWIEN